MVRFLERTHERGIRVTFPDKQTESFLFLLASAAEHCERQDSQDNGTPVHTFHGFPNICILLHFYLLPARVRPCGGENFSYFASA